METPHSGDQYNLKWNNHLANFVQTFVEHQHGETLVDVTLSCEGQYIKTHKLILSACSDYFHSIFQVHANVQHPIILLNGVKFTDLKYILHFMYHGEVKVLDKDLPNVLALGETLQIKGLSSVKLRDAPPEDVPPPTHRSVPKKIRKKEPNQKDPPVHRLPLIAPRPLPSEIPHFVSILDNKTPFDYNKRSSAKLVPVTQSEILPKITSVSSLSEAAPSSTIMIPENPPVNNNTNSEESPTSNNTSSPKDAKNAVSKPPHAFMIFANEWRKKLTVEHPEENNKEISIRLGTMWKNLLPETKKIYYREAQRAEEGHKQKYPNYVSQSDSVKRKSDVLSDSTNNGSQDTPVDPMEVVEIQERISLSDSE